MEIGWLLGCSKSEGWEYCFAFLEGRSGWKRGWLLAQSLSRYSREEMGFWLGTSPEVQGLYTETFPPVVWFLLHSRQQNLWALLQMCLNPLLISAWIIQWGPIFWVAVLHYKFYSLFVDVLLEKSQCVQENNLLTILFGTRGMRCWTSLRIPCCPKVYSLHLREGFNFAWGTVT